MNNVAANKHTYTVEDIFNLANTLHYITASADIMKKMKPVFEMFLTRYLNELVDEHTAHKSSLVIRSIARLQLKVPKEEFCSLVEIFLQKFDP